MLNKPAILLTFAQDKDNPLNSLHDERSRITEELLKFDVKEYLRIQPEEFLSLDEVYRRLDAFHNQLAIFHFAGHADGQGIELDKEKVYTTGLSKKLGQLPNLQLVFINGCSSLNQATDYINEGVKVAIVTKYVINDTKAARFAISFYKSLAEGLSIEDAFASAESKIIASTKPRKNKGLKLEREEKEDNPWKLVYQHKRYLKWSLHDIVYESKPLDIPFFDQLYSRRKEKSRDNDIFENAVLIPSQRKNISSVFHLRIKKLFELKFNSKGYTLSLSKKNNSSILYGQAKNENDILDIFVYCDENINNKWITDNQLYNTQIEIKQLIGQHYYEPFYVIQQGDFEQEQDTFFTLRTEQELVDGLVNFKPYLEQLQSNFTKAVSPFNKNKLLSEIFIRPYTNTYLLTKTLQFQLVFLDKEIDEWLQTDSKVHIALMGDYGTGKTAFLEYYAHKKAQLILNNQTNKIPIFVRLNGISLEGKFVEEVIVSSLKEEAVDINQESFIELVDRGYFLFILDGFDEMKNVSTEAGRRMQFNGIWKLAGKYNKIIISGRPSYFPTIIDEKHSLRTEKIKTEKQLPYCEKWDIPALSDSQIQEVLEKYYTKEDAKRYLDFIINNEGLNHLCKKPLIIQIVAQIINKLVDELGEQSVNFELLVKKFLEELVIIQFEKLGMINAMDNKLEDKVGFLLSFFEKLATKLYLDNPSGANPTFSNTLVREELENTHNQNQYNLNQLEREVYSSYFIQRVGNDFQFVHKSFYEYFVSKKIVNSIKSGNLNDEIFKFNWTEDIVNMIYDVEQSRYDKNKPLLIEMAYQSDELKDKKDIFEKKKKKFEDYPSNYSKTEEWLRLSFLIIISVISVNYLYNHLSELKLERSTVFSLFPNIIANLFIYGLEYLYEQLTIFTAFFLFKERSFLSKLTFFSFWLIIHYGIISFAEYIIDEIHFHHKNNGNIIYKRLSKVKLYDILNSIKWQLINGLVFFLGFILFFLEINIIIHHYYHFSFPLVYLVMIFFIALINSIQTFSLSLAPPNSSKREINFPKFQLFFNYVLIIYIFMKLYYLSFQLPIFIILSISILGASYLTIVLGISLFYISGCLIILLFLFSLIIFFFGINMQFDFIQSIIDSLVRNELYINLSIFGGLIYTSFNGFSYKTNPVDRYDDKLHGFYFVKAYYWALRKSYSVDISEKVFNIIMQLTPVTDISNIEFSYKGNSFKEKAIAISRNLSYDKRKDRKYKFKNVIFKGGENLGEIEQLFQKNKELKNLYKHLDFNSIKTFFKSIHVLYTQSITSSSLIKKTSTIDLNENKLENSQFFKAFNFIKIKESKLINVDFSKACIFNFIELDDCELDNQTLESLLICIKNNNLERYIDNNEYKRNMGRKYIKLSAKLNNRLNQLENE